MKRLFRMTLAIIALSNLSCGGAAITDAGGPSTLGSITVTPPASTLLPNGQLQLQAVFKDPSGAVLTDVSLTWTVRDPLIASVTSSGMVTALALGTTQVAASARGASGVAAITVQKTPVVSVVVRPNRVDAVKGSATQLTATTLDGAQVVLTDRVVIWSTSNASVATVDATGLVVAVGEGTATITATSEGKSDAATFTVGQGTITTVTVTPNPVTMVAGQTTQLVALAKDVRGNIVSGRPVIWSSSNTGVASVSPTGVVTAVGGGTATITATSDGVSGTSVVTVSLAPVESVTVSPQSPTITTTQGTQLTATVFVANGVKVTDRVVTWSSSNPAVATVSSTGALNGVAPGVTTITASAGGKSGSTTVTVTLVPVTSIVVTAPASIQVGTTGTATAVVRDQSNNIVTNRPLTWSSSDVQVATVSQAGVITGVGPGTVTITATSGGVSGNATVVVNLVPVGSVTVDPLGIVQVGGTVTATAVVRDANNVIVNRTVTWLSSDPLIATVSAAGVVTGVAPGSATISASAGGQTGSAAVTVSAVPVGSVAVTAPSNGLLVGANLQATAIVRDANNVVITAPVAWSTSDPNVATVSSTGLVTGVAAGTVTITGSSGSPVMSGSVTITVSLVPVGSVTVTSPASVQVGSSINATAVVLDANGNVVVRPVVWSTSDAQIASVDQSGHVLGVAPGIATITATTSNGQSGSTTISVTPIPVASVTVTSAGTVQVGASITATATPLDANGTPLSRPISWSTSDAQIATVSAAGVVTGVAPGTVTITATSGGQSGTTSVTVTPVPIASVTVSAPAGVNVGATVSLTATVRDANNNVVTTSPVTWSTSDALIATVTQTGDVTGVAVGSVTVTASSGGQSGNATLSVTLVPVATVTVSAAGTVQVGNTITATATVRDASNNVLNRPVTWSTSDPNIATVDQSGVITGVAAGPVTITASSGGQSGTASVTVTAVQVATSVVVTPPATTLVAGQGTTLTATVNDMNGQPIPGASVTWTTSDAAIAAVSNTGAITTSGVGTATITATSGAASGTATIQVDVGPAATVTISPKTGGSAPVGTPLQMSATAVDSFNNPITNGFTWSSSDPNIATVDATGLVTGVAAGTVTITVTNGSASDSAPVTVP